MKFKNGTKSFVSFLLSVLFWTVIVLAVFRVAFGVTYFKVYVIGASMEGTLNGAASEDVLGGDYVYAYHSSSPRRGDIVIIDTGAKPAKPIIKRVIALGGDEVEIVDGVLYLNGKIVDEPYVLSENNTSKSNYPKTTVADGEMFFLGDNRDVSVDSRSKKYGMMPVAKTIGIVADWSMSLKGAVTAFNTFFEFTLPDAFRR